MQYFDDPVKYFEQLAAKEKEKKSIKHHATAIGFTYITVLLVGVFWATAALFLLSRLGISQNWFYKVISDTGVLQFVQTLLSLIMFTVPFYVLFKWSGDNSRDVFPLGRAEKGTFLPLALIGIGFCAFANIANSISGQIFLNLGFPDPFVDAEYPSGIFGFALTFISTAVMPPLVEEFAMRGVVMGILRKFGDGFAILTSAVLFGLIHANFQQMVFAGFVGLVLGFVAVKSKSLWTAIFVHFFNNLLSVAMYYISEGAGITAANVIYMVLLIISLFCGILGLYMFSLKEQNTFKLDKRDTLSREGKKYLWFFISPVIIIAVALTLFEAIFLRIG